METTNKIQITPIGEELIIREGAATPPKAAPKKIIAHDLLITNPADYAFHNALSTVDCFFIVNRDNMENAHSIVLLHQPQQPDEGAEIHGYISASNELADLSLNREIKGEDGERISRDITKFRDFLRRRRYLFAKRDAYTEIIKQLYEYRLEYERVIEEQENNSGGRKSSDEIKLKKELNISFDVKIPLFSGYEPKTLAVNLLAQFNENSTSKREQFIYWLECLELQEIMNAEADRILDETTQKLKDAGYLVVQQTAGKSTYSAIGSAISNEPKL